MSLVEAVAKHCCIAIIVHACRQVAAQSKLFISAGFETTALTLAYCIYLLSKHPKQQAKLQHEVDNFKGRIGYGDLESLQYTSAVVNESLRLFPPSTTTVRKAAQDVKVRVLNIVVCHCSPICAWLRELASLLTEANAPYYLTKQNVLQKFAINYYCSALSQT